VRRQPEFLISLNFGLFGKFIKRDKPYQCVHAFSMFLTQEHSGMHQFVNCVIDMFAYDSTDLRRAPSIFRLCEICTLEFAQGFISLTDY